MSEKIAAVLGPTGMIGNYLCEELLADDYFTAIRLIVRRPYERKDPRIQVALVDFSDAESVKLALEGIDVLFGCIGTTQKNVKGDNEAYRKIDFDIPLMAAKFCRENGCDKFIFVSSVGANSHSNTFYLRLKGELEKAIQAIGIRSVHAMQPSMLLGERKEKRTGERLLQRSMKLVSGLFTGSFQKFRAIEGRTVAKAMLQAAKDNEPGFFRHTYNDIVALSNRARN